MLRPGRRRLREERRSAEHGGHDEGRKSDHSSLSVIRPRDAVTDASHHTCNLNLCRRSSPSSPGSSGAWRLSRVDAYNVTLQRELTDTVSAEIAYVGNRGRGFIGDGPAANYNQATIVGFGTLSQDQRKPFFNCR